jgi:hypothetical protein
MGLFCLWMSGCNTVDTLSACAGLNQDAVETYRRTIQAVKDAGYSYSDAMAETIMACPSVGTDVCNCATALVDEVYGR